MAFTSNRRVSQPCCGAASNRLFQEHPRVAEAKVYRNRPGGRAQTSPPSSSGGAGNGASGPLLQHLVHRGGPRLAAGSGDLDPVARSQLLSGENALGPVGQTVGPGRSRVVRPAAQLGPSGIPGPAAQVGISAAA